MSIDPSTTESPPEAKLTTLHGRVVNDVSDVYQYATDEEESERLSYQHLMFKMIAGKNYEGPVESVLTADPSYRPRVLDIGSGSNAWGVEMAREFPNCDILGVDLSPHPSKKFPPNYRTEVCDANLGLKQLGEFDLVHTRTINAGIKSFRRLISEIADILRPNGMILLQEPDYRCYAADKQTIIKPGHLPFTVWFNALRMAAKARGGDIDCALSLRGWLEGHPALLEVEANEYFNPIAPYFPNDTEENKRLNKIGEYMREDFRTAFESIRPLLIATGTSPEVYSKMVDDARQQMVRADGPTIFLRMINVWARKTVG